MNTSANKPVSGEALLGGELLAPAGDWQCLRAALANGADAVYFGLARFNARARAANFTLDELPEVVRFIHARNARAYVAFNTLVFGDELPEAAGYIRAIAQAGTDAVIVQDLGLADLIHTMAPTLPIHASTQMTLTEPAGIERLRELGVRRVILARELSLKQIAAVAAGTDMELEVFVHGALCVSYSGQCLASLTLGGRSANRGQCAQPCRLPYELMMDGQLARAGNGHWLSPRDLVAYDRIAALVRLGVAGFKIEGRLKGPNYVAAAVQTYRAAIDAAGRDEAYQPSQARRQALLLSFSRGPSHGWLDGADHHALVNGQTPGSTGLPAGQVTGKTVREVIIHPLATCPLKPGDGVVFRPSPDAAGGLANDALCDGSDESPGGRVYQVRSQARGAVALSFGNDVDLSRVAIGSALFKTDDPALEAELAASYARVEPVRRVPLRLCVRAEVGQTLEVTLTDETGQEVCVRGDAPLEPARKHPLTAALLAEQFSRLGETPFSLGQVQLLGSAVPADELPVMAPKSMLNDLRRRAVEMLVRARESASMHAVTAPDALDKLLKESRDAGDARDEERREQGSGNTEQGQALTHASCAHLLNPVHPLHPCKSFTVLVRSLDQLDAVLERGAAIVWADVRSLDQASEAVNRGRRAGVSVGLASPRIIKPGEEHLLQSLAQADPPAVLVRNLAALEFFRRALPKAMLVGDFSLNAANPLSVNLLRRWGAARVTPGYDVDAARLADLAAAVPAGSLEVIVRAPVAMFHTEHCLYAARAGGGPSCAACSRPCERHELALRDRRGAIMSAHVDAAGRNTVFAPAARDMLDAIPALARAGVCHFRVEFLDEQPDEVTDILDVIARRTPLPPGEGALRSPP